MRGVIYTVTILMATVGCRAPLSTIDRSVSETTTTTARVVARDSTIYVQGDISSIEATMEQLLASTEKLQVQSGKSTVYLGYDRATKTITADCVCDSNAIKVRLYEKFIETIKHKETTTVKEQKLSWWERTKADIGGVAFFVLLILGLVLGLKAILKTIKIPL